MFQARHYILLAVGFCYVLPTLTGLLLFGSAWKGFWIGGVFRHVWVLNMTWCVNSVAHLWGDKPYADINPSENFFVSLGAMGEGWHNFHHKYPSDYATGEFGMTSGQWNPTKLFIDLCAKFHFASDLKRSRTAKSTRLARKLKNKEKKKQEMAAMKKSKWDRITDRFFFGRSEEEVF